MIADDVAILSEAHQAEATGATLCCCCCCCTCLCKNIKKDSNLTKQKKCPFVPRPGVLNLACLHYVVVGGGGGGGGDGF